MAANSASWETPNPQSPPNKRLKLSPSSKGKAPIDSPNTDGNESDREGGGGSSDGGPFTEDPRPQQNCGICFSEEGEAIRGYIDSCDHYFCFLCIIEWSKIESRCPLCKRRFVSIRRMRRDGSFIGDRTVTVPVRNQDTNNGTIDPYANISCNVCHGSSDESLLLLCDVCDSAMHSYCAGLGFTVPEGDWFCKECTLMKTEESNSGTVSSDRVNLSPTPCYDNADVPSSSSSSSAAAAQVSIVDIVRDPQPRDSDSKRFVDFVSQDQGQSSLSSLLSIDGVVSVDRKFVRQRKTSIRTLQGCRNTQGRIRALRENWNAFRSGFVRFPQNPTFDDRVVQSNTSKRNGVVGNRTNAPDAPMPSSDKLGHVKGKKEQSVPSSSGVAVVQKKCSYDVDKAWKMLNLAKSMTCSPGKMTGNNVSSSSKSPPSFHKSSALKDKKLSVSDVGVASRSAPSRGKDRLSSGLGMQEPSLVKKQIKSCGLLRSEQPSCSHDQGIITSKRLHSAPSPVKCTNLSSLRNGYVSVQVGSSFPADRNNMVTYQSKGDGFSAGVPSKMNDASVALDGRVHTKVSPLVRKVNYPRGGALFKNQEEPSSEKKQMKRCPLLIPGQPFCSHDPGTANNRFDSAPPAGTCTNLSSKNASDSAQADLFPDRKSMTYLSKGDGISAYVSSNKDSSAALDERVVHMKAFPLVREEDNPLGGDHQFKNSKDSRERNKSRNRDRLGEDMGKESTRSDAKSEILSLVKLNMKLLTNKDKKLGVDMFRKIARRSTHKILAACGLEKKQRQIWEAGPAIPVPSCSHHVEKKLVQSTLMPNCCRACFYAFVKEIVSSLMSETLKL